MGQTLRGVGQFIKLLWRGAVLVWRPIERVFYKVVWQGFIISLYTLYRHLKSSSPDHNLPGRRFYKLVTTRYVYHLILTALVVVVVVYNLGTRQIYAEDLSKQTLLINLWSGDKGEIVEEGNSQLLLELTNTSLTTTAVAAQNSQQASLVATTTDQHLNDLIITEEGGALMKPTLINPKTTTRRNKIITYTVEAGDTISSIAAQFNVSVNTILWENKLSSRSIIRPGDKLTILPTNGVTHRVKNGETVGGIAKKYKVDLEEILEVNNIPDPSYIVVGQKLIIPNGRPLRPTTPPRRTRLATIRQLFTPRPPSADGGLIWPLNSRRITQYYHYKHPALDIAAPYGSPIYAVKGGRIIRATRSRGYGINVVIDHGGGWRTLYAHMSRLAVSKGEVVNSGQIIGFIGCTGWCTGPHVHYEIRINGRKVNPLNYY